MYLLDNGSPVVLGEPFLQKRTEKPTRVEQVHTVRRLEDNDTLEKMSLVELARSYKAPERRGETKDEYLTRIRFKIHEDPRAWVTMDKINYIDNLGLSSDPSRIYVNYVNSFLDRAFGLCAGIDDKIKLTQYAYWGLQATGDQVRADRSPYYIHPIRSAHNFITLIEDIRSQLQSIENDHGNSPQVKEQFLARSNPQLNELVNSKNTRRLMQVFASIFWHDIPEDTPITLDVLSKVWGKNFADIIYGAVKLDYKEETTDSQEENYTTIVDGVTYTYRQFDENSCLATGKHLIERSLETALTKLVERWDNVEWLDALGDKADNTGIIVPAEIRRRQIAVETWLLYMPVAHAMNLHFVYNRLLELCPKYFFSRDIAEYYSRYTDKRARLREYKTELFAYYAQRQSEWQSVRRIKESGIIP